METREFFKIARGTGVLATSDRQGKVDAAIYATPHFMDDGTIAFIMQDRLTHHNLQTNDYAAYLFKEDGPGYKGIRLFLRKVREEANTELVFKLRRRSYPTDNPLFLVFFKIEKELPLIGAGDETDAEATE